MQYKYGNKIYDTDPYGGYTGNQIALIIFGGIFGGAALVLGGCALLAYLLTK